jgi:hypothetical protein
MYPEDPTFNNCEESLLLYQYDENGGSPIMQQLGDSMRVHYVNTTPTYYMTSHRLPYANDKDTLLYPVYERYFTEPQTVYDTFYAGFTQSQYKVRETGPKTWYECRPPFFCLGFEYREDHPDAQTYRDGNAFYVWDNPNDTPHWVFSSWYVSYFIFPILTPEPEIDTTAQHSDTTVVGNDTIVNHSDTLIVGGDTLVNGDTLVVVDTVVMSDTVVLYDTLVVNGDTLVVYDTIVNHDTIVNYDTIVDNLSVTEQGMLGRLTGVMPNPAAATAKVVSSFGLTKVEAFNLRGERVATLRLPEASLSTTLDVSHWPAGIYLLRIHTPQGTCVKRLTVSR